MADQPTDQASEAPMGGGMGGPPGGNPSAYGGMTRGPMNPSMAPPPAKKGGMINKPKLPEIGKNDINNQILKQVLGEFLGTMLLVFFGIGSVITAGGITYCYWHEGKQYPNELGCLSARASNKDLEEALKSYNEQHKDKPISGFSVYYGFTGPGSLVHISFAFGIAVASIAQAIGHVSGAHLNPAVSWGLVAAGECSIIKAAIYTPVQIIGAVVGAGLLKLITWNVIVFETIKVGKEEWSVSVTEEYKDKFYEAIKSGNPKDIPKYNPSKQSVGWSLGCSELGATDMFSGIAMELFLTFILVLVVCGVCDSLRKDVKGSAPLAIGFTVFLCHVVGIRYTGSSVNPARTIGPAFLVSNDAAAFRLGDLVVYIVGPILGGIFAGITYNIFFRVPEDTSDKVAPATRS